MHALNPSSTFLFFRTYDAASISDPPILRSGLGGDGNPNNSYCVEGPEFGIAGEYYSPMRNLCPTNALKPQCCLMRRHSKTMVIATLDDMSKNIKQYDTFWHMNKHLTPKHGMFALYYNPYVF